MRGAGEGTAVTAGRLEGAKVYQGLGVGVSVAVGVRECCISSEPSKVRSGVWVALWQLVSNSSTAINVSQPRCRFGKVHAVFIGSITTRRAAYSLKKYIIAWENEISDHNISTVTVSKVHRLEGCKKMRVP
jgi:hypothetical protein